MKCKCNNIIPQGRVDLGYTVILTQMAVQFGYVEALKSIKKELSV